MLERERRKPAGAVAEDAASDEFGDTRVHRTTIVPQAPDDLDCAPAQHSVLLEHDLGKFQLDEPLEESLEESKDFEVEPEEPTRVDLARRNLLPPAEPTPKGAVRSAGTTSKKAGSKRQPSSRPPVARVEAAHPAGDTREQTLADKWYLRVQLNTECVADLWVRDLTPHNVLVWSDDMETWVPLLTVRELRDAIRDAHDVKTQDQVRDSNFVFLNTQPRTAGHEPAAGARSQNAPVTGAAPVAASHWSLPKSRTISNVPPPLLTTAVPIVAAPAPRLSSVQLPPLRLPQQPPTPPVARDATARPVAMHSTVPPVVTSIEPVSEIQIDEVEHVVDDLVEIPKAARVPIALPPARQAPTFRTSMLALLRAGRSDRRSFVPAFRTLAASIPVVHVERFLWLAAGVAVASATMLVMRDNRSDVVVALQPEVARVGSSDTPTPSMQTASLTDESRIPVVRSSSHREVVHRLEDLPIVGQVESSEARTAKQQSEKPSTGNVAALPVKLTPTSSGAETAKKGKTSNGFDTGAARRSLGSAANRASRCAADGPASGSVVVTFAPTGFAQSASISGLSGKGVNVGCVLRAFQEARLSPFTGGAVTVRKAFQIL